MKHWSTVTDNAFNKAWKISCPTCKTTKELLSDVNSILWYKKQCYECETAAKRMYSEEDMIAFHKWAYFKNRFEESDKTTKELLSEWFEKFKKK